MQLAEATVRQKILVIDDEEDFTHLVTKFLAKSGFEPMAACSGAEGIALAIHNPPDLILCDLEMPTMHGFEVLAALRADSKLAEIPVLFLTGQSAPGDVRRGLNLGADDYLTKPVQQSDLLQAIEVRLQRRHRAQAHLKDQVERALHCFAGALQELRDPLFVILGYTDLLKPGESRALGDEANARSILDHMQQAAVRMQGILSEILFLAKSRTQQLPFDPGPFDLRDFCEQLVAEHDHSQRLRFECGAGRCPIVADALRLRQALENLLANACKFSDGAVTLRLIAQTQRYLIETSDTGIGIPIADQANIFEPFFRGANTAGKPGHGLGLCVARSCIQQHGGNLRFTSQVNQGTTFVIELPASPPAAAASPTPAAGRVSAQSPGLAASMMPAQARPPAPAEGLRSPASTCQAADRLSTGVARWRAIIVDDDPLVRGLLRDLLERESDISVVGEAGCLSQARLLASQHQPAVIFLDVTLPDGSGFDLLPGLKPTTCVVIVTSAEEYAAQAFDCEATDYLLKPIGPERLQKALGRVRERLAGKVAAESAEESRLAGAFLVKTLTEKRLVKFSEIKSILAYGEYSWVYWDQNKKGALLRKPLKQWQAELPEEMFIRVHRGAIVNLNFLDRVERLPAGRLQVHLLEVAEPILVSLSQTPILNRRLKALRG